MHLTPTEFDLLVTLAERPGRVLTRERLLAEAKHLLFVGKENIKEISFSLGFEDPSYFSRFFRKMTKLTPEEFKKNIRKQIGARE